MHQCPACSKELRDENGVDVCRDPSCGWRAEADEEQPRPDRYEPDPQPKVKRAFGRMVLDEPPENATPESAEEAAREALAALERARLSAPRFPGQKVRPRKWRAKNEGSEIGANEGSASTGDDDESPIGGRDG